jgi:Fe-S cluster assembly protein SufD
VISLPTNRDENWRYANLRPLAKARVDAVPESSALELPLPAPLPGYQRWVFVDGKCASRPQDWKPGNHADSLDAREAGAAFAAMLDDSIAAAGVDFALARINAARGHEVLHIALPDDTRANVEVVFVSHASAAKGTSYPRVQAQLGRNARLNLVERHLSAAPADSVANAAVDIAVGAGAEVSHVRVQNCADAASAFDTLVVHVGESGRYQLRTIALGALTSRSTVFVKLAGRNARCEFVAASVANGLQTHDIFAEVEYAAPATTTKQIFRGIATERGKLAFNGKMIVRENAHDADSDQSLKSLLTGNGAEAAARPQLEIYTDKVRAKHGATTGKLDDQMLFYLLSRGIDRQTAAALLQWAFIEDAVAQVQPEELRRDIETLIAAQLREVSALDGLLRQP